MSRENNLLNKTAERLGIQDPSVIKKSEEFLRCLQGKGLVKNINDIARTILCLDLAASFIGNSFEKESALKLSGLKKSAYQTNLHVIEKLLNLDRPLTVSELCVQLGCTVVKELAEEILDKYGTSDNKIKDLKHPQYAAAAVYTACKLKKISIEKSQCLETSRLKSSQWKELTLEFEKFASSFGIGSPRKRKKDSKNVHDLAQTTVFSENEATVKKNNQEGEEVEEYEAWKKRILVEAYKALDVDTSGK